MLIKINNINPQKRLITKVVDILKNGGIVAYPTDTYYGIGCDIMNKKAIELGMGNSHFVEPTGLSSKNVSTAQDLARMVYASNNYDVIRDFSTTSQHVVSPL